MDGEKCENSPFEEIPEDIKQPIDNLDIKNKVLPVFSASFVETSNKVLKYKCPICNKKFKNQKKVENHVNSHVVIHSIYSNGNFKCSKCNCYLENTDSFKTHLKTHTKMRGRPRKDNVDVNKNAKLFMCDRCTKCFKTKQQLLNHAMVHLDIKPFECLQCHKSFKLKQQLQNHEKVHEDVRPFACENCDKAFKFKQQLENHEKTHTDERPFKCTICEKGFKFKQQLQIHYRVHDGLRPFECELCSKTFKLKQQLYFHMKVHSDERPFQCITCEKSFKMKQQLQTHYKVHTRAFLKNKVLEPDINLETDMDDSNSTSNFKDDKAIQDLTCGAKLMMRLKMETFS